MFEYWCAKTGKMGTRDYYCCSDKSIFILFEYPLSINTVIMRKALKNNPEAIYTIHIQIL